MILNKEGVDRIAFTDRFGISHSLDVPVHTDDIFKGVALPDGVSSQQQVQDDVIATLKEQGFREESPKKKEFTGGGE